MRADAVFGSRVPAGSSAIMPSSETPYESLGHLPQSETSSAATERGSWALIPPLLLGDDSGPRVNFIVLLDLHTACWSLNRLEAALLVRGAKGESVWNVTTKPASALLATTNASATELSDGLATLLQDQWWHRLLRY